MFDFLKDFFTPFTNLKAISIILVVGFIVYFNSLFNGFVLDDISQIIHNTSIHSIQNILSFFQGSTFHSSNSTEALMGVYYKPLLTTSFSIIYSIFGESAFYFHLFQLVLQITNAIIIFYVFKFFFSKKSSLFLSLLFLIHPINVESVVYISGLQEVLFFFFGMLGLIILLKTKNSQIVSKAIYAKIFLLLLFSLLSKETGILFIFILPLFAFLFVRRTLKFVTSSAILSLGVYFFLRFFVGHIYFDTKGISDIANLSLSQRLVNIPSIILYYLKTFFTPINPLSSQTWIIKNITFQNFYLPLIIDGIFFMFLLVLGIFIKRKAKNVFKTYLFFIFWFWGGLGLILQIFPLDQTVADRWFYFPIFGLLGIGGVFIQSLKINSGKLINLSYIFAFTILFLLSLRTMIRNTNWYSTYVLVSHDILFESDNPYLQNTLALELSKIGDYKEAEKHYQYAYTLAPQDAILSNLAITYAQEGDLIKAEETYRKLIEINKNYSPAYVNLAYILVKSNKFKQAAIVAHKGLILFSNMNQFWVLSAISDYNLGEYDKALQEITQGYNLSPSDSVKQIYDNIKQNQPIDTSSL